LFLSNLESWHERLLGVLLMRVLALDLLLEDGLVVLTSLCGLSILLLSKAAFLLSLAVDSTSDGTDKSENNDDPDEDVGFVLVIDVLLVFLSFLLGLVLLGVQGLEGFVDLCHCNSLRCSLSHELAALLNIGTSVMLLHYFLELNHLSIQSLTSGIPFLGQFQDVLEFLVEIFAVRFFAAIHPFNSFLNVWSVLVVLVSLKFLLELLH